ncbi:MAG: hypothetical protein P8012_04185 [Desulfobacterales bacterium]
MPFKRNRLYVLLAAGIILFIQPAWAGDKNSYDKPWKKVDIDVGYLITSIDTSLNLGAKGIGVEVDAEDFFGMDTTNSLVKIKGFWRFTENRRHRLDFKWSSYRRDGYRKIGKDFTFEDKDGNEITIPSGTEVNSHFNVDMYKISYSYSFFQDDRIDLGAAIGLYWMPIDIGVNSSGFISVREEEKFDAPLPTIGI